MAIFSMAINKILFYFQRRQEHREDSSERLAWGTEILQKENFIWQNHSHGPVKGLLPAPTATRHRGTGGSGMRAQAGAHAAPLCWEAEIRLHGGVRTG